MKTKEVIESQGFKNYLEKVIFHYRDNHRRIPPAGKRWARTPYDILNDKGIFTVDKLKSEYEKIASKKSSLSYSERKAVVKIIAECVIAVCINNQKKKQETGTTNKNEG